MSQKDKKGIPYESVHGVDYRRITHSNSLRKHEETLSQLAMLQKGLPLETICELTGLTKAQIEQL